MFKKQKHTFQEQMNHTDTSGFTILELLFVVGIMAVFYALMVTNFANWRTPQFLKMAQNELVTNLQKSRTAALTARNIKGQPAKFYILKFTKATPTQYVLQGVTTATGGDTFYGDSNPVETVRFPSTVSIKSLQLQQPSGTPQADPDCVQVAFGLPFGKMYIDPTCNFDITYKSESSLMERANSQLTIQLQRADSTTDVKTIILYGVSGRIEAQ